MRAGIDVVPGMADSGVGSQTTTLQGASGNSVAWETNYTWSNGPNNVKSCKSPSLYPRDGEGACADDGHAGLHAVKILMLGTTRRRACR